MNKKDLLKKLISVPEKQTTSFWSREYKLLKKVLERYPDMSFWMKFDIREKPPSIKCLLNNNFFRYVDYHYSKHIPEYINPEIKIGDKEGRTRKIKKKVNTIRKFIENDEKNK